MSLINRLSLFPVTFFSVSLGLAGFTIAWQRLEELFLPDSRIGLVLPWMTLSVFSLILLAYLVKLLFHTSRVREEWSHPVRISFFPAASISMLLLSVAFLEISRTVSFWLWTGGALLHLVLTIRIVSTWIHHDRFRITHMNPAWFIPAVGNIVVPIAGIVHAPPAISWFFFSIGLVFWLALFVLFLYRIIFHAPLAERILPTMFILIAPPAVGFIALTRLTGQAGEAGTVLYNFAAFMTLLLLANGRRYLRLRFSLSWWAYSFPLAAMTISSILMYRTSGDPFFKLLALGLGLVVTILILILVAGTIIAIKNRRLCVEEEPDSPPVP